MQGLPWQMQAAFFMAGGLCVAVPLLLIPKSTLARWSQLEFTRWQLRLLSPNFITLYGLVLTLFGAAVFFLARKILPHAEFWGPFCGLLIAVKGRVLDILDGKTSKAEQEAGLPRSKFDRWVGSWFDPGADKGGNLPFFIVFTAYRLVSPWIMLPILATDFIGTLLREPFTMWPALRKYPKHVRFMDRLRLEVEKSPEHASDANPIGKIKTPMQCFGLVLCVPYWLGWLHGHNALNCFFSVVLVLTVLSPLSRKIKHPTFVEWMKRLKETHFSHRQVKFW